MWWLSVLLLLLQQQVAAVFLTFCSDGSSFDCIPLYVCLRLRGMHFARPSPGERFVLFLFSMPSFLRLALLLLLLWLVCDGEERLTNARKVQQLWLSFYAHDLDMICIYCCNVRLPLFQSSTRFVLCSCCVRCASRSHAVMQ